MSMNQFNQKSLSDFIQKDLIKVIKKIKGKHPPISEIADKQIKILKIKAVYDLNPKSGIYYLFIVKNHSNQPKIRYFLTISLASQSSDLLVSLAKEELKREAELKLIQYSIHPEHNRVNLLLLKELMTMTDYSETISSFKAIRQSFRKKLDKIKTLIENK